MNGALVTFKKELLSYFVSPVSWVIAVVFYLWRGFELYARAQQFALLHGDPDQFATATYGAASTTWMVILVPGILTMRCFAEERRTGSMEMLMTAPVRDAGVVLGKWGAATVFYALLWLPTALLLPVLELSAYLDCDIALGPVFSAYLGMFVLSAMLLAFGCFASSLTDNVLLAALLGILFNFGLLMLSPTLRPQLGELADKNYYVRELLDKLDVGRNFVDWFARGLVDTSQVAFFLGGVLFFLFLCTTSLQSRRVA